MIFMPSELGWTQDIGFDFQAEQNCADSEGMNINYNGIVNSSPC